MRIYAHNCLYVQEVSSRNKLVYKVEFFESNGNNLSTFVSPIIHYNQSVNIVENALLLISNAKHFHSFVIKIFKFCFL